MQLFSFGRDSDTERRLERFSSAKQLNRKCEYPTLDSAGAANASNGTIQQPKRQNQGLLTGVRNTTSAKRFCDSQVERENWTVVVYLFGSWSNSSDSVDGSAPKQWLEVASATAFCAVGVKWAFHVIAEGYGEIGKKLLLEVEAVGMKAGLADTHQVMMMVCWSAFGCTSAP
jgi:hypothetical protein